MKLDCGSEFGFCCFSITGPVSISIWSAVDVVLEHVRVFLVEITEGAEGGVRGGLAEATEAGIANHVTEFFELLEVAGGGFASQDFIQQIVHLNSSGAAGDAFAAGFVH